MSTPAFTPHDFWLRAYALTVGLTTGGTISISSSDQEPNALRFTFDVKMYVQQPLWWAEISIYNLDPNENFTLIQQGDTVTLQAGYATGSHKMATIFQGKVFQPIWTRENVVDFKLTLQCFAGNAKNFISTNFGRLQTQRDIVSLVARTAYKSIQESNIDDSLSDWKLPRGGVLFGDPQKYFQQIASQNDMVTWVGPDGLNIVDLTGIVSGITVTPNHAPYAPPMPPGSKQKPTPGNDYCIIGTPQQTWEGVDFQVLLDPSLKIKYPPDVVNIDMSSTAINLLPLPNPNFGSGPGFIPPPTASGNYIVAGLRHYGDTRGNPWYSEITGVTQNGLLLALGGGQ